MQDYNSPWSFTAFLSLPPNLLKFLESQETVVRAKQIKIQELSEAKDFVSGQITWPLLSFIYSFSSGEAWAVK